MELVGAGIVMEEKVLKGIINVNPGYCEVLIFWNIIKRFYIL